MTRATTRSQKPTPSQSQRQRGTQNARAGGSRRAQAVEEDEDEDEEEEEEEGEEEGQRHGRMDLDDDEQEGEAESELRRKANDLVRLALFTEHKRATLKREDISKKVLGQSARAFNTVFALAQEKLKMTFGMELVELPSRAGLEQEASGSQQNATDDLDEARKGMGMKKKAASLLSKTYILRSTLDPLLIEHAALTDVKILEDEAIEAPADSDDDGDDGGSDNDERAPKSYGSIISWSRGDQLGATGVLYVVLALVLVSGRVMSDMDLRTQLKRLRLPSTPTRAPVHFTSLSTTRSLSTDAFLSLLQRQNYLDRTLIGGDPRPKAAAAGKRSRATQDDGGERAMYEWRWGARALCEVGEADVARFIAEFMIGGNGVGGEGEEEGEEGGNSRAERKKETERLARMLRGVERAAGGKLMELR